MMTLRYKRLTAQHFGKFLFLVSYSINKCWADPCFLAVTPLLADLVMKLVVGCHYFPPGPQFPSQSVPNNTVSSLHKFEALLLAH